MQGQSLATAGENGESKFEALSNRIQGSTTWSTSLEGRLLTLIDAMVTDKEQKEAFKSLVKHEVRAFYRETNGNVMYLINAFTEAYEGEKIEYQTFHDIMENRDYDFKRNRADAVRGAVPHNANPFSGK